MFTNSRDRLLTTSPNRPKAKTKTKTKAMPRPTRQNHNPDVDFRGKNRSNATHASTTDPDARLCRKSPGTGAMLCFIGLALMENRSSLIVQGDLTKADSHAERRAALGMVQRHASGSTLHPDTGGQQPRQVATVVGHIGPGTDISDTYRPHRRAGCSWQLVQSQESRSTLPTSSAACSWPLEMFSGSPARLRAAIGNFIQEA